MKRYRPLVLSSNSYCFLECIFRRTTALRIDHVHRVWYAQTPCYVAKAPW